MMRNKIILRLVAGFFCMTLMVNPGIAGAFKKEITITTFPCTDALSSFGKFNPLITYLNDYTHFDVSLEFFEDVGSYERAMKNNEIDFVLQEPYVFLEHIDRYNKDNLLRTLTWEGKRFLSGVVVVRQDSGIQHVGDLRGRTVMFGPKVSSARWAAAAVLFNETGIDINADLKAYSNGGCCEDIAFNVYLKAVDAGVICDHFLSEHSKKQKELGFDSGQLVVIGKTRPVPTKVFIAARHVAPEIVTLVNQALLSLNMNINAHKKILYAAELGGFLKTDDQAYGEMKTILERISAN